MIWKREYLTAIPCHIARDLRIRPRTAEEVSPATPSGRDVYELAGGLTALVQDGMRVGRRGEWLASPLLLAILPGAAIGLRLVGIVFCPDRLRADAGIYGIDRHIIDPFDRGSAVWRASGVYIGRGTKSLSASDDTRCL